MIGNSEVRELVRAAEDLVAVCRLAATNLSEEFESMIIGPANTLRSVLEKFPDDMKVTPTWDGVFRIDDCSIERFTPSPAPPEYPVGVAPTGLAVKIKHIPTGREVEMSQHMDYNRNLQGAMRALRSMVERDFQQQL